MRLNYQVYIKKIYFTQITLRNNTNSTTQKLTGYRVRPSTRHLHDPLPAEVVGGDGQRDGEEEHVVGRVGQLPPLVVAPRQEFPLHCQGVGGVLPAPHS